MASPPTRDGDAEVEEARRAVASAEVAPGGGNGGGDDVTATTTKATTSTRTIRLPDRSDVMERWGRERTELASASSLPRYDETDDEAREHDALETQVAAAAAAATGSNLAPSSGRGPGTMTGLGESVNGAAGKSTGKKKGMGGLRRAMSFGSGGGGSRGGSRSGGGGGTGSTCSSRANSSGDLSAASSDAGPTSEAASSTAGSVVPASAASSSALPEKENKEEKKKKKKRNPVPPTSWTPISGTKFSVRTGPNYKKNGRKSPSLDSLYDVAAVRCYRSDGGRTAASVVDIMPLPLDDLFGDDEKDGHTLRLPDPLLGGAVDGNRSSLFVPDVLVYHVQLPYEQPNVFKPKDDGRGGEIIFYLRPSRRFLDEISGIRPPTPATRHFVRWCQLAESDPDVRSLFKCMALVRNLDRHNLGWLAPYNGKPVLITESGQVRRGITADGIRFLDMSANVHKWAFLAKKGFVSLIPRFRDMRLDVGWTIEASADSDLPECVLGAVGMNYIDESTFVSIDRSLQAGCGTAGNVFIKASDRKGRAGGGGGRGGGGGGGGASTSDKDKALGKTSG